MQELEKGTTAALVRGVCAKIQQLGFPLGGFRAYIHSDVLSGSGLSSSASFEVLIGVIINSLYCDTQIGIIQIAQIAQEAEREYFGKPCGLMDQLACAIGGIVAVDFEDALQPVVEQIGFQFNNSGYVLCMIDTGANHANLTNDYAEIPKEMRKIAQYFGKTALREIGRAHV